MMESLFHRRTFSRLLVFCVLWMEPVSGNKSMYFNHWQAYPYSPYSNPYRSGGRLQKSRRLNLGSSSGVTALVARRKKETKKLPEPALEPSPPVPDVSFDDLGPIGKTVAGVTQVCVSTLLEYCSGFAGGFSLGSVVGLPGLLFRPMEPGVPQMLKTEFAGRLGRMNTRSMSWAKNWGGISAAFGGFKVAIKVVRNGKEDAWNQILSSAAAGAFFARAEGPQAMLKGALLYGGMIYLLSGGMGGNQPLQQYTEQPVEF